MQYYVDNKEPNYNFINQSRLLKLKLKYSGIVNDLQKIIDKLPKEQQEPFIMYKNIYATFYIELLNI